MSKFTMHLWISIALLLVPFVLRGWIAEAQYSQTASSTNTPQAYSQYSLDSFLGTYDLNQTSSGPGIPVNLTHVLEGIPLPVALGGERQIFNKSADGTSYQQTILRNDSTYNSAITFQLGVPATVSSPGSTVNSLWVMLNATTLQGNFSFVKPGGNFGFSVQFQFYPDASGFVDVADETFPSSLHATANFNRCRNNPVDFATACQP